MVRRMSPLVRQIDFGLEWMLVEAGKALYRYENENKQKRSFFLQCYSSILDKIINLRMFILC